MNASGFTSNQQALAEVAVIGRLVAPSSDLASWRWLRESTALVKMLPADISNIGKDAVYEKVDQLLANKGTIERAIRIKEANLFRHQIRFFFMT